MQFGVIRAGRTVTKRLGRHDTTQLLASVARRALHRLLRLRLLFVGGSSVGDDDVALVAFHSDRLVVNTGVVAGTKQCISPKQLAS